MRVSDIYQLGRTQPTLDFVDVDCGRDTPLFLSPRARLQHCRLHGARSAFISCRTSFRQFCNTSKADVTLTLREPCFKI